MLRIAIGLLLIAAVIMTYLFTDRSKDAQVSREKAKEKYKKMFMNKVAYPLNEAILTRASEEKVAKAEAKYKQAGCAVPYTVMCLINAAACVGCFILSTFLLKNVFLGLVGLCCGWMVPDMIINFIINRRIKKIDTQIGIFMRMVTERYKSTNSFYKAFQSTVDEFRGEEPIYSELVQTSYAINSGEPMSDALMDLGKRTSNKYMIQFADYYTQTAIIGTENAMDRILTMAVDQYDRHMDNDRKNAREISEIGMQSYTMLAMVPGVAAFGVFEVDDYIPFMTTTLIGKIGVAVIVGVWMLVFWIVTFKLSAPLDT